MRVNCTFLWFHNVTMKRPWKCELDNDIWCSQHLLGGPHLNEHSGGLGVNARQKYYYYYSNVVWLDTELPSTLIVKNHVDTKVHIYAFITIMLNDANKINNFSWFAHGKANNCPKFRKLKFQVWNVNTIGHILFGYVCFDNCKPRGRLWKLTSSWNSNHTSACRWSSFRTT